jgi:hypothetical protein
LDYFKKVRMVALASLALDALLLLSPHVMQGPWWSDVKPLLIFVLGFSSFTMLIFPPPPPQRKRSELSEKEGYGCGIKMLASIACYGDGCRHACERLFHKGDYVRKIVGICPACGGELYVKAIYAIDEKRS